MTKAIIILSLVLGLTGCITTPDFETGEGCWRYGVKEGTPTRPPATNISYMSMGDIVKICGKQAWGCYFNDRIYLYNRAGQRDLNHEQCHAIGLMEHNECYGKGYGIGSNESSCEWDKQTD